MNLPSMKQDSTTKRDPVPMFHRKGQANIFIKGIKDKCILCYGEVGQNVIHDTEFQPIILGEKPHYNSPRIHPNTGLPIENSRMYAKEIQIPSQLDPNVAQRKTSGGGGGKDSTDPSATQYFSTQKTTQEPSPSMAAPPESKFDEDEIPLTESAQNKLDKDVDKYEKKSELLEAKLKIRKDYDDACATMIIEHIGAEMMHEIEVQIAYKGWKDLPHVNTNRSVLFLRMFKVLFSSGNSSDAVDAMSHLFNLKQTQDLAQLSAFFNAVTDAYGATIGLIQDPKNAGMINGLQIQTMVLINGLDKMAPATKEGIKAHLDAHPDDALLKPGELIAAVLKAHKSDLNTDRVSEQSSAFAATLPAAKNPPKKGAPKKTTASAWVWQKDKPDKSEIPGSIHCANCKLLSNKYYYSHSTERCKNTAERELARQQKDNLHAKVAAIDDPSLPTATDYATLKTAYDGMVAFMSEHHPDLEI